MARPGATRDEEMLEAVRTATDFLGERPVLLLAAIAVLPAFFVPMSPLLLLGGSSLVPRFGPFWASALVGLSIGLNLALSFLLAAGPFRKLATGLLARYGKTLPWQTVGQGAAVVFAIRMIPGIPYPVSNYLLGVIGCRFWAYFIISLLSTGPTCLALMLGSGALVSGQIAWAIAAVAALILVLATRRMILTRLRLRDAP